MSSQRLRLPSGSLHSGISAHVRTPRQHLHVGVLPGCQPAILPHGGASSSQHERALSKPTTALAQQQRWCGHVCRAQGTDTESREASTSSSSGSSGTGGPAPEGGESDNRISKTLAGLDALLGVTEAPPKASTSSSSSSANGSTSSRDGPLSVGIAKEALNALAEAEAQRLARGDSSKAGPLKDNLEDQFTKIIEKARKMADEQSKKSGNVEAEQQQLRQEFENLMQTMFKTPDMLDKDELKKLKETVFGPMTFWVTEMSPLVGQDRMGIAVRGNLRDDREKVFAHVVQKVKELFGTKYEVLMIEDTEAEVEGAASPESASRGPRVAFQIVPFAAARPPAPQAWQFLVALALAVAFVASTGQLSLLTNVQKLPKETLEYLQNPDSFPTPDGLPPGIENWDPTVYLITTIPLFFAILTSNFFHEVGHIIAAALKGVKLGPSYFIPNPTLGSFGAITQFASLLKNRKDMWDVAAAGPLAGSLAAGTLFFMGLAQSVPGLLPAELLIPISTGLFKGSLGLGTVARAVLGEQALSKPEILVSPLLVAGWCGAITQALNLLPVGSLDGGRMVQASFGKQALALSSFFTYLGLGLGLLGSSMALPFGLYVLICQRTAEKYVQDAVTPAGDPRATATMVAILAAILVLVPIAPEFADALGIGPDNPFF